MVEEKSTSPWVWIGCGCLASLVVVVGVFVALGALGVRELRSFEADMKDPEARRERVEGVLGTDQLPAGYYPMMAFSIPFALDVAMISSAPPDDDGELDEIGARGFVYVKILALGGGQEIDDFFEGRTDDPDVLSEAGINVDLEEVVARGEAAHPQATVDWVASRGDVDISERGSSGSSLVAVIRFDCPGDNRRRIGIWFTPDPRAEDPEAPLDGSAADPAAVEELIAPLRPCA